MEHPQSSSISRFCLHCGLPLVTRDLRKRFCSTACGYAAQSEPLETAFGRRVARVDGPGCWLWTGSINYARMGYGELGHRGRRYRAHRLAYILAAGPIPQTLMVCHTCDTPACVRNDKPGVYVVNGVEYPRWGHLYLAPRQANMDDMVAKGRSPVGERNVARFAPELVRRDVKVPDATVWAIYWRCIEDGVPQRTVALEFGVDYRFVNGILHGRTRQRAMAALPSLRRRDAALEVSSE